MYNPKIEKPVGRGGLNKPLDVAVVEALLNAFYEVPCRYDPRKQISLPQAVRVLRDRLIITGDYVRNGKFIELDIQGLQMDLALRPDFRLDPGARTFKHLVDKPKRSYESMRALLFGSMSIVSTGLLPRVNYTRFEELFRKQLQLKADHGLKFLFEKLRDDANMTDVRWVAYTLATAYHETAFTFKPVEEAGKGAGRDYAEEFVLVDSARVTHKNVYYGRGYVQLTWKDNYEFMGKELGIPDLVMCPEKALEPETAYRILSYWMRNRVPNVKDDSKTLKQFIVGNKEDYFNARKIVNDLDCAAAIAAYAETIEMLLRLSI